ncbi:MAG: F0F1 ATP synthase subunit A [Thermoguttaceae bacterium]
MSIEIDAGELVVELANHVKDTSFFHVPFKSINIPDIFVNLGITKFVMIEMAVALVMVALFVPMARKMNTGKLLTGRFWQLIELLLVAMRDYVIVPSIGKKHATPYLPFLWSLFFFILFCNLAGIVPWAGSPTGSISVTVALASCTFAVVLYTGMKLHGGVGFWKGLVPHMDLPKPLGYILVPMLFGIEVLSLLIKHVVLSIRLMANMFAGHLTLAVFLAFISMTAPVFVLWAPVTAGSIAMSVCINFLELFVAFLQAFIFTLLSSIYIGMSIHQH